MGNDSTNSEDLEIRLMKELHEIKLQLQEVKTMFGNSQLQVKMAIAEHQTNCPMMYKKPLLEGQSYEEWKRCHAMHTKETGKSFDIWFDRGKKLVVLIGALWILLSTVNWSVLLKAVQ